MKKILSGAVQLALLSSATSLSFPVHAQVVGLEEIVVTAQRREQDSQDVGVAMTAISGQSARQLGVFESRDIARIAPGVVFDSTTGGTAVLNLTIRGVSQSDFSPNQESPNSLYIDEVYVSSSNATAFPLYDLARIEVLRGPQGTLFGRASSGGLAHFITNRPAQETDGYLEAGVGNYSSRYIEGALGGALTDSVRGRVAGRYDRADGWFENRLPGGEDTFETYSYGLRGQLEADLTETLTARVALSLDKSPRHNQGTYRSRNAYIGDSGQPAPLPADLDIYGTGPGNDFAGYRNPHKKKQSGDFNNVGFVKTEKLSPTLYLDWEAATATISSITNYTSFEFFYNEDADGGPMNFAIFPAEQDLSQFSQEFRATATLDRLTWTAGAYYLSVDQSNSASFSFPALSGTDFAFTNLNAVSQELESIAAFGQVEYRFTDTLTGTAGLRYTHDEKEFASQLYFSELGNGYFGGTGSEIFDPPFVAYDFSGKETEGMWSGKVQLDYRPVDNALIYGSVSRGVKGPGFNTNIAGGLTYEETPFESESLIAYEAGAKADFLNRTLRLNASVFYYDYSGFQGYAFNGLQGVVGNYDGTFKGGELEFVAAPGGGWTIGLSGAFMESELQDVPTVYGGVVDQESIMAPRWTSNGYLRKEFAIGENLLALQWFYNFIDDRYSSIDNNFATFVAGSFMHNARLTYTLESGIEISAWMNNISDVDRPISSFDTISSTGSLLQSYAKPRMFGMSLRKGF